MPTVVNMQSAQRMIERGYALAGQMASDGEGPVDLALLGVMLQKIAHCALYTISRYDEKLDNTDAWANADKGMEAANAVVSALLDVDSQATKASMNEVFAAGMHAAAQPRH